VLPSVIILYHGLQSPIHVNSNGHQLHNDNTKHPVTEISANSLHNDYFRILDTSQGTAIRTVHIVILFDLEEITEVIPSFH
jgi:hypothetical protein